MFDLSSLDGPAVAAASRSAPSSISGPPSNVSREVSCVTPRPHLTVNPSDTPPPPTTMREYAPLFDDFQSSVARRVAAERDLAKRFPAGEDEQERKLHRELSDLSERREAELAELSEEFARRRAELQQRIGGHLHAIDFANREALREIERRLNEESAEIESRYQDSTWVTSSVLDDTSEDSPKRKFDKYKTLLLKSREDQIAVWTELESTFQTLAERYGYRGSPPTEPEHPPEDRDAAQERFQAVVESARLQQGQVERQLLPRLFVGFRSLWLFLALAAVFFIPLYLLVPASAFGSRVPAGSPTWIGIVGGVACVAALIVELLTYTIASMRQADGMRGVQQAVAEAGWVHQKWLTMAREELHDKTREFEAKQRDVVRQREQALQRFEAAHASHLQDIETRRDEAVRQEKTRHETQRRQIQSDLEREQSSLDAEERNRLAILSQQFETTHSRLQQQLGEHADVRRRDQAQSWHALKTDWEESFQRFRSTAEELEHESHRVFPEWPALVQGEWSPAREIPPAIRLGEYQVDLRTLPDALPQDPRLAVADTEFRLPVELAFPNDGSLLLQYRGAAGRAAAVEAQQTVLLRLLTMLPPGTLRLTILDPVGLGESFAGFMHLADFDEKLVTSRIWTESNQIEARLADLTEHMENVFQKYLRNEFATIEEYNLHAGEVAEPYHFLVLSDFPAKCSEIAARRLTSIVTSGPRCGVYTLMTADLAQPVPNAFNLQDLQEQMRSFVWRDDAFRSARETGDARTSRPRAPAANETGMPFTSASEFESASTLFDGPGTESATGLCDSPLLVDPPPPPELFTSIVKMVGRESKDARRVEVSFGRIAPKTDAWWTQDSRRELDVALGRAGATKLQHVMLGKGTSQHMLVAGKTGSGKSTFLHALITNVALHYSPEEVRFYLIDFKKGVEFKDYASCGLPHADVIAIESDREFGVSALQRLDAVLQERGELFRRHGVQDIAGFRNAHPETPLPRILLVVDEFQEFFIEDDKLSQSASLLLDRLVRQGRAFGIHVVLGSQTLGGAYSLARSTLGQVAVRVALQCSEADAHLILSESNTAARLLSRPGEAIYNDANGLLEGNHPFQIAWLSDEDRETYLRRMAQLAKERGLTTSPPVVFEGNIPSDPSLNDQLVELLRRAYAIGGGEDPGDSDMQSHRPATLYCGESVEIGPPTALTFERHAGSHLLLVGADSEAAYGVMANGVLALAARGMVQHVPAGQQTVSAGKRPSIYLFDGSSSDVPEHQWWRGLCEAAPAPIRRVSPREAAEAVGELTGELQRREADRETEHASLFVCVYNVSKFRDLRKADEDYGFGGFGSQPAEKPADPGKQFADLIANGPEVGIHVIVWCDSAGNLERWFSRQSMKDLESRIAFQMNAADSSNLIDSPAASRLGVNRALLYREETGTVQKFRPYGPPASQWLRGLSSVEEPAAASKAPSAATVTSPDPKAGKPSATTVDLPAGQPDDNLEIATDLDSFSVS
ncbi:MAG: hypothetical protein KDA75_04605 [Planctomycetaceae bacterium]|nr:hypothetical protein [Planctomycetaceae bacterium]